MMRRTCDISLDLAEKTSFGVFPGAFICPEMRVHPDAVRVAEKSRLFHNKRSPIGNRTWASRTTFRGLCRLSLPSTTTLNKRFIYFQSAAPTAMSTSTTTTTAASSGSTSSSAAAAAAAFHPSVFPTEHTPAAATTQWPSSIPTVTSHQQQQAETQQWAAQHYSRPPLTASGHNGFGFNGNSAAAAAASGFNRPQPGFPHSFLGINGNPGATPGATVHHPPGIPGATVRNTEAFGKRFPASKDFQFSISESCLQPRTEQVQGRSVPSTPGAPRGRGSRGSSRRRLPRKPVRGRRRRECRTPHVGVGFGKLPAWIPGHPSLGQSPALLSSSTSSSSPASCYPHSAAAAAAAAVAAAGAVGSLTQL
jgi:hypothetical protein